MKRIKVIGYEFFTIPDPISGDFVAANLFLENGKVFTLYNIPKFIAMECMRLTNKLMNDYRLSISEVLAEIPELERVVSENIEDIVIDDFDPNLGVYSATIRKKNGDHRIVKVIPSHALLLSLITGRDLYVDENLIKKQVETQEHH